MWIPHLHFTDETTNKPPSSTTTTATTVTPNRRPTNEIESTTGQFNTEITSFGQPSTKDVDQIRTITSELNDFEFFRW